MAVAMHSRHAMHCVEVQNAVSRVGSRSHAQFEVKKLASGTMPSARLGLLSLPTRSFATVATISLRVANRRQSTGLRGRFLGIAVTTLQSRSRRERDFKLNSVRAEIKKKIEKVVNDFGVGLQDGSAPGLEDDLSQLAVSLPLGLASFEGLFLMGWVASLRGLLPGSRGFFGAADLILCGIMFANCAVGWYALEHSRSEVDGLVKEKRVRKVKAAGPGLVDMGFSLAVSLIPCANLFLWFKFATRQKHLSPKAKAALIANALVYEGPRLFALLLLISGGLWVFLQVGLVSNFALLLSALHRPFEEARVQNEKVLMEVSRAKMMGGKKGQEGKPQEISAEERERIARLKELEEFDMLLAQSSSPGTVLLPGKCILEFLDLSHLKQANKCCNICTQL